MNNTRIIATIGPATNNKQALINLKKNGMNVARLNGSHNNLEWHSNTIKLIQDTLPDLPILLDIPGRKIRTKQLKFEPNFSKGDIIILTTDGSFDGKTKIPVNYSDLHKDLSVGDTVLADDGVLKFKVTNIKGRDIFVKAETSGCLKSCKGINVPQVNLNTKLVTQRDKMMISFAQENKVDFIGISFVESKKHILAIKELISPLNSPRIISKIENQGGINNMVEIIENSDAIMIDRGDLSMETELDSIALSQKKIIKQARKYSKSVIVATELLHSMIENNFPTKAEVCDISNAVIDGCGAVMLSGETAIGKNPFDAVSLMSRVITKSEDYVRENINIKKNSNPIAIADAIVAISNESSIDKIIAVTRSGYAAESLSLRNLKQPIIAVSDDESVIKSFNFYPGVKGVFYNKKFPKDSLSHMMEIVRMLLNKKYIHPNDQILLTAVGYPNSGNRMNLIETHLVNDLIKSLKWN